MTMYTIEHKGRQYAFLTIDAAKAIAAEIFAMTGVVVGIEYKDEYDARGALIKVA